MVVGVYCEEKKGGISFEECMACSNCLPTQIIKSLRVYENKPKRNVYYIREVIGCLRKAYFDRKCPRDEFSKLRDLYCRKRGELFGAIVGHGWNELDGSLSYVVDGEPVKLTARLDCYDPDKKEIVELKSLSDIENKELPRQKDVLQVQCYGTIFKGIFRVERLRLVYLDMNGFRQINVGLIDKSEWLKERVEKLHRHIRDSKPPAEEPSWECKFCPHKSQCIQPKPMMPVVKQAAYRNFGGRYR
jgi:CRISPR/Cas system-associated exonuclease Cas4 (RecB family)